MVPRILPHLCSRVHSVASKPPLNNWITRRTHRQQLTSYHCSVEHPARIFRAGDWRHSGSKTPIERCSKIGLLTWNINGIRPDVPARTVKAVEYLNEICLDQTFAKVPLVIFLQEVTPTSLDIIQASPWIRSNFHITELDPTNWPSRSTFGLLSLVDRRLATASAFRIPFESESGRYALYVDIEIDTLSRTQSGIIRLCNTHLESYNNIPRLRPKQLASVSKYLHAENLHAGVAAGDFNALHKTYDYKLHIKNELKDAYLENGLSEHKGFTWGMHSCKPFTYKKLARRHQSKRLDKILYTSHVQIGKPRTFGRGLKIGNPEEGVYVSDHLGLGAMLRIQ